MEQPKKPDHVTTNVDRKKSLSHSSSTASSPSPQRINHDTNVSSTEPPNSLQEMERPLYRIRSAVFKSNTQTDWSDVSNHDSLLSIHASFKNDHPFWRSGELGRPGHQASTSDHMFSYSAQHPEIMRSRELGLLAEETMKEVIRESETTNRTCQVTRSFAMVSRSPRGSSNSSIKSFAFSIKAGDGDSSRTHSSVRSASEDQGPVEPQVTAQPQPPVAHRNQKKDRPESMANTARPKRWFRFRPVFSCCSLW
ncbi:hypothetical protein CASFOL_015466 [Castilleja foliolosa]|uniref:Uncharacterized protein n=1 Tax=Castilleja foliolosa TaxID=1961234 RepID=A0ABD3DDR6_9LAMI